MEYSFTYCLLVPLLGTQETNESTTLQPCDIMLSACTDSFLQVLVLINNFMQRIFKIINGFKSVFLVCTLLHCAER